MKRWMSFLTYALIALLLCPVLTACSRPGSIAPSPQPAGPTPVPTATTTPSPAPLCPAMSPEWRCGENPAMRVRNCVPATSSEAAWACYEDLVYSFAVEYPAGWNWTVSIDTGLHSDVKVAKRHEFRGPEGALDIDIWHPTLSDLAQWLEKQREATGPDLVVRTEPNAKVAGYPAVAFVMGDPQNPSPMLTVYVGNGQYIYRLWFTLHCDPAEIPVIRRMLDTFRLSAQAVPAEVPEEVWREVQRAFAPPRCAPPPPTPGPAPTPRPVVLPSADEAQNLTVGWKAFEDAALGLRFRYPPEYEVRIQPVSSLLIGVSVDRPQGERRETFVGMRIFLLEEENPRLTTPEGLESWIRELPEGENPVPGGGPIRVVERIQVGGRPAFVVQEPLWPGDPPNLQALVVIGRKRVLWLPLASPLTMEPEQVERLWPLQMAFLATLEVTR
ncbi:MAG: hypothetical protein H5T61_01155 [Thermoflexales bacterium]|nr:hypothetical protein [Thermoflexales bacterium]